jgi:hypothetical protein
MCNPTYSKLAQVLKYLAGKNSEVTVSNFGVKTIVNMCGCSSGYPQTFQAYDGTVSALSIVKHRFLP